MPVFGTTPTDPVTTPTPCIAKRWRRGVRRTNDSNLVRLSATPNSPVFAPHIKKSSHSYWRFSAVIRWKRVSCSVNFPTKNSSTYSDRPMGVPSTRAPWLSNGNCASPLQTTASGLTPCCGSQFCHACGDSPPAIPDLRLPQMQTDVGMALQLLSENRMHLRDPGKAAHHVHAIKGCK